MSRTQARERIVVGAADMLRRRGSNATSIREVARHSRAPLGSTYHYFPGGKRELVTEAVRYAGGKVGESLRRELDAGAADGLRAFLELWRDVLTQTDFRAGCPVLAVAVEEPGDGPVEPLDAAAEVFAEWEESLARALRRDGADGERAAQLATVIVAAVEGAVVMCRASRSTGPLDRVAAWLVGMVEANRDPARVTTVRSRR